MPATPPERKPLRDPEYLAKLLGVSERAVRDWAVDDGEIEYMRLGGDKRGPIRFTDEAIERYLKLKAIEPRRPRRRPS